MIRRVGISQRGLLQRVISWKNMENYYKYEFTNKMNYIDHTVRFPVFRTMDIEGNVLSPEYEVADRPTLSRILDLMVVLRESDKVSLNLHRQTRITFCMTSLYEEAIALGIVAALKMEDPMVMQNREQGGLLWRGYTVLDLMHSLKGTDKQETLGKALGLHYVSQKKAVFPTSAPMGSKIGHAAGAGYAYRVKNMDRVAVCFFGEGAASEGDFHSALNFASTLGSQTLFVCRNNGYAISTPIDEQYAGDGIAPRGIGYGIPAIKVDGCDPLAMYYVGKRARELIIERKGPVLIEAISYRGGDHSTSDSAQMYRTKEVMENLKPFLDSIGDPIVRLGKYMQKKGWLPDATAYIDNLTTKTRADCLKWALELDQTPFPDRKHMFEGVYHTPTPNLLQQAAELDAHLAKYGENYPLHDFKD